MNDDGQSDEHLIKRYVAGDKSTLAILVKRWHKIFCEKAYWILKDKALSKDVAQECWLIIINKLNTLRNVQNFKSWALRIVYHKAIDAHKRQVHESKKWHEVALNINERVSIEKEERLLQKKKLLLAIKELSSEKQDIIRLFYLEEYSLKEISTFLKIPLGTVKSRLFKAREKLKTIIKL